MAQHLSNTSFSTLLTGSKPYNVNGGEWALEKNRELQSRIAGAGASFGINAADFLTSTLAGDAAAHLAGFGASSLAGGLLIGLPVGMAVSHVISPVVKAALNSAKEYNSDISIIQRLSPMMGGNYWNRNEASTAARGAYNYYGREIGTRTAFTTNLGVGGYREIMRQGLSMDMFHGSSPEQLVSQMENAASIVKFLTGVLGSKDITDTMQAVGNLKAMGVNAFQSSGLVQQLGLNASKYGQILGVNAPTMLNRAMQMGGNAFGQYGLPGFIGIQPAMSAMAIANEMEKRRFLSPAQMAAAGGQQGIATQMTQFNAALTNNPAIGLTMLAAGWTGRGGYSQAATQNALNNGGYFGALSAGMGKIAGSVDAYADFFMNMDNIAANAGKDGTIDEKLGNMLQQAMKVDPTLHNDNVAAMFIMNMANQMGSPISRGTALTIIKQQRNPHLMAAIKNRANTAQNKMNYARNAQEASFFRPFGRMQEQISNTGARISETFGGLGRAAVDKVNAWTDNMFLDQDFGTSYTPTGIIGKNAVNNIHSMSSWNLPGYMSTIDSSLFNRAYNEASSPTGFGIFSNNPRVGAKDFLSSMENSSWNSPATELSGGPLYNIGSRLRYAWGGGQGMEAIVRGSMGANYHSYFEGAAGQSKMSVGRAKQLLSRYGINADSLQGKGWFDGAGDPLGVLKDVMNGMSDSDVNRYTSGLYKSKLFSGMSQSQAQDILKRAGITDFSNKDMLLQQVLAAGNSGNELGTMGAQYGLSKQQVAAGLTNIAGSGSWSKYSQMHAAPAQVMGALSTASGVMAHHLGRDDDAQTLVTQGDFMSNLSNQDALKALQSLGLNQEDLMEIVNSADGTQQLQAFADALSYIGEGTPNKIDYKTLEGNDKLSAIINGYTSLDSGKAKERLLNKIGENGVLGWNGSYKNIGIGDRFKGVAAKVAVGAETANIHKGLSSIYGINISKKDLDAVLANGNLSSLIEKSNPTTEEGKALQEKLLSLNEMSISELKDMAKQNGLNVSSSMTDEEARKFISNSFISSEVDQANKKEESAKVQSRVDEGMEKAADGKWAMRTMVVGGKSTELSDAEKLVRDWSKWTPHIPD